MRVMHQLHALMHALPSLEYKEPYRIGFIVRTNQSHEA